MNRKHLTFDCEGSELFGTLDNADKSCGLLLVSGGNEIRSGAFSGQAKIAAKIAEAGYPVFRYDRRGVGDSSGKNTEFLGSRPDIEAAMSAFRKTTPHVQRVLAWGNCDAAGALMLFSGAGADALILSNPWTYDEPEEGAQSSGEQSAPPPDAIRARYKERLSDPTEWLRLLRGGVDLKKLAKGLVASMRSAPPPSNLATKMQDGLAKFQGNTDILLAGSDRTAQAFASIWLAEDPRLKTRKNADHAFSHPEDQKWLIDQILAALNKQAG